MFCFHRKWFVEQQLLEVFYTGNNYTRSYLLQQQNCWAFIFSVCLLNTYRRENIQLNGWYVDRQKYQRSFVLLWTWSVLDVCIMCWKILVVMRKTGNKQDKSAAIGGPYSLTSNIFCEGRLCPHLKQQTDQKCELNPNLSLEFNFKNWWFYQLTGLVCADFLL